MSRTNIIQSLFFILLPNCNGIGHQPPKNSIWINMTTSAQFARFDQSHYRFLLHPL